MTEQSEILEAKYDVVIGREAEAANIAVVQRLFGAAETRGESADLAKRWAAYEAMYDPTAVIHEPPSLPYGGDYKGAGAVSQHAQAFKKAWDGLQNEDARSMAPQFFAEGDQVVVLWRQQGRSRTGVIFNMPAVSVYRLREERVVYSRMFHFDAGAVREFLESAQGS